MELRLDIGDLVAFAERAPEVTQVLNREVSDAAFEAGALVLRTAQDLVPVDTGNLKSAIGPVQVSGGLPTITTLVPVGSQAPYAAAVEYGRGPVTIRPRNAKALRFQASGKTVFARSVTQPARKGKPFMGPALQQRTQDIVNGFQMALEATMRWWAGGN
jgi:hypothetical protein